MSSLQLACQRQDKPEFGAINFCLKYKRPLSTAAMPDDARTGTLMYERTARAEEAACVK